MAAADSGQYDQATILRRQKIAEAMLSEGMRPRKIEHWAQGLAQLGQAGIGGYMSHLANEDAKASKSADTAALAALLSGGSSAPATPAAAPATPAPAGDYSKAIASIESGGAYDKLGPVTKGDRAYGKYQVMGANIPEWTAAATGRRMTPDEFLSNPEAQEAVFKHRFGQYADKYGPEGAAKAWFAGEKGMNNPNARDVLGTTVADYGRKFMSAYAPDQPYKVAGPPTAAPQAPVAQAMTPPQMPAAQPAGGGGLLANATPQQRAAIAAGLGASEGSPARAIAMAMISNLSKSDAPTDEMREYNLDSAQRKARGENPLSFFDFKSGLKKAGATNVNVDASTKGENKFREKGSLLQAERFDKIVQGGTDAKSMISDIQSLRDIGSRITTGKTAEMTAALGPYAEALGVKVDGLDDLQTYNAIIARLAPQMRVPGSGATSDFEMRTFLEGLPGLGKTPGGNELISKTLEAMAQHKVAAAEIASKALNEEITRKDAEKMLRELPDPLALWKQTRGEMKPQAAPKASPAMPQPGEIRDGYRFKGGNPADQKNWEQIS